MGLSAEKKTGSFEENLYLFFYTLKVSPSVYSGKYHGKIKNSGILFGSQNDDHNTKWQHSLNLRAIPPSQKFLLPSSRFLAIRRDLSCIYSF